MKHLIVALSRSGTGEAQVGARIAADLLARGHRVSVVCDPAVHGVFRGSGADLFVAPAEGWGPIEPVFAEALGGARPDGVLLTDFVMASNSLERRKVGSDIFRRLGGRLVVVDTWHAPEVSGLDAHPSDGITFTPKLATYPYRMAPVPFIRPTAAQGFSILPAPVAREDRARWGLPASPVLLLATSAWQHRRYGIPAVEAVNRVVPPILTALLARLPAEVHIAQVGPAPLRLREVIGDRFTWMPSLPPAEFRSLIASVDAVLSLNASATTNALAVACGTPVLTVVNSAPGLLDGVEVYPFLMWPYSMWGTLMPVLRDNPYGALLNFTELRDPGAFVTTAMGLLTDPARRAEETRRRDRYLEEVAALPDGATLYLRHLEA